MWEGCEDPQEGCEDEGGGARTRERRCGGGMLGMRGLVVRACRRSGLPAGVASDGPAVYALRAPGVWLGMQR